MWMENNWDNNHRRPSSLGEAFGYSETRTGGNIFFKQLIGSIIVLLLFVIIFSNNNPKLASIQGSLKYLLAKESDYTPVLEAMVKDNIWQDSYDKYVMGETGGSLSIPVSGKISKNYGKEVDVNGKEFFHNGLDIVTEPNAPVRAAADGTIQAIEDEGELGKKIIIDHGKGLKTVYKLLGETEVEINSQISQGEIIGKVMTLQSGKQGKIHFEVIVNGKNIDPLEKIANNNNI